MTDEQNTFAAAPEKALSDLICPQPGENSVPYLKEWQLQHSIQNILIKSQPKQSQKIKTPKHQNMVTEMMRTSGKHKRVFENLMK